MASILRSFPIWLIFLVLGLGTLGLTGVKAFWELQKHNTLQAQTPALVDAGDLGAVRSFPFVEEVNVRVRFDQELYYTYWTDWSDGSITEWPVMFFFDPSHEGEVREVLGAIAWTAGTQESTDMHAYLDAALVEETASGSIVDLNGIAAFNAAVTHEEIVWAAEDLGVTMSPDFVYLAPFIEGRENRLAAEHTGTLFFGGVALILLWISGIIFMIGRRVRMAEATARGLSPAASKGAGALAAAGFGAAFGNDDDCASF